MKKILSTIALALSLVLATPAVLPQTAVVAQAAAEVNFSWEYWSGLGINATTRIEVSGAPSKAKITYSSNKKSVATVSSKGVVKGVSVGKAKITVKQTYKGKTKKLKTLTVQVRNAKIDKSNYVEGDLWIGAQPGWVSKNNPVDVSEYNVLSFKNPKAKYTYYTDNKDLVMDENGKATEVKNSGVAEITVKETYKNKTRKVGTFSLILKDPEYVGEDTLKIYQGQKENVSDYISACGVVGIYCNDEDFTDEEALKNFALENEDGANPVKADDVLELVNDEDGYWDYEIKGKNPGIRYAAMLQYNYLTQKYDKVFARFKIEVVDTSKANKISFPWDDDEEDNPSYVFRLDEDDTDYVSVYLDTKYYSGSYQVTSSDPNVVTAEMDDDSIKLKGISGGTATVTLKVNGAERAFKVQVDGYDDDDWDE